MIYKYSLNGNREDKPIMIIYDYEELLFGNQVSKVVTLTVIHLVEITIITHFS